MKRRDFLRTMSLALLGGVFVPRYERWFRPNRVYLPRSSGIQLVGTGLDWPVGTQPGDLGLLLVETRNEPLYPPEGWTLQQRAGNVSAYYKIAGRREQRVPLVSEAQTLIAYRGVDAKAPIERPQTMPQTAFAITL